MIAIDVLIKQTLMKKDEDLRLESWHYAGTTHAVDRDRIDALCPACQARRATLDPAIREAMYEPMPPAEAATVTRREINFVMPDGVIGYSFTYWVGRCRLGHVVWCGAARGATR